MTVYFDSNIAAGLPWSFEPERRTIDVKLGEVVTVYYKVINEAARVTSGQAAYNVNPPTTGIYFEKINCFCFTEQTLKPGEKRDMAVVFYVDPKLAEDSEQDGTQNDHALLHLLSGEGAGTTGRRERPLPRPPPQAGEDKLGAIRPRLMTAMTAAHPTTTVAPKWR